MRQQGFKQVYQIKGGILNYFAETVKDNKAPHWFGDCVVFDKRKAVQPDLSPTEEELCFVCFAQLTEADHKRERLAAGMLCTPCNEQHLAKTKERQERGDRRRKEFMDARSKHCSEVRKHWQSKKAENL